MSSLYPQVTREQTTTGAPDSAAAWSCVRTILVPPDIVGVRPRSPACVRRRTPWRPQSEERATTVRAGEREWFSDRLFVQAQKGHGRTGFGTSITVHVAGVAALIVFFITRPDRVIATVHPPSLPMPVIVSPPPAVSVPTAQPAEQPKLQPALRPPAPPPPPTHMPTPADSAEPVPAPIEAPAGIARETGAESRVASGVEGGVPGGIPGGVVGGVVGGAPPSGSGTGNVVRVGPTMQPPRKIKDVKPVYPAGALPSRSQGAVVIEATIGTDGKVQDAKVLHSVAGLDQAALDAVRQWEYTPSLLNGVAVAVIMTVVVNFAMQ